MCTPSTVGRLYRSDAATWLIHTLDKFLLSPAQLDLFFLFFSSAVLEWIRSTGGDLDAVLPATTNPPPRVKFFSLTHSIPPNTIDLTYWREGAWLLRGIRPQHIEQAVGWRRTETDKKQTNSTIRFISEPSDTKYNTCSRSVSQSVCAY